MAHKKGVGSTDNGRDSKSKRLGVKLFGGQAAKAGNIIVRQRGTRFHAGENVYMGKDFTLHAAVDGTVTFKRKRQNRTYVSVLPADGETVIKPRKVVVSKEEKPKAKPAVEKETPATRSMEAAPEETVAGEEPEVETRGAAPVAEEPAVKEEKAAPAQKSDKITLPSGKKIKLDDLKIVEGVGPKIESLLQEGGIHTWADLANAPTDKIQAILDEAGPRYRMHDPATWAKQAQLAHEGKWEELEAYQDRLQGGREVSDDDAE